MLLFIAMSLLFFIYLFFFIILITVLLLVFNICAPCTRTCLSRLSKCDSFYCCDLFTIVLIIYKITVAIESFSFRNRGNVLTLGIDSMSIPTP